MAVGWGSRPAGRAESLTACGDRCQTGVGLGELVDELASVAGGEEEPEAGDAEQCQPLPAAEPDGDAKQERGDDGDDCECGRLGIDAEELHPAFAVALLDMARRLSGVVLAAGLAAVSALARGARGGGRLLAMVLMTLDRRADGEEQA